jgi:pimeloyl-ACP methyl ester carboxylesterase
MATFLLVHGMFHGGWCWERLVPKLEAAGHVVHAPDLAGCGSDPTPHKDVSLDTWARMIAGIAERAGDRVILVGHSRGGIVVSQAAEHANEHVSVIVYLAAMMLPNGNSARSMAEMFTRHGLSPPAAGITPLFTENGLTMRPPANLIDVLYGPLSTSDREWAEAHLSEEAASPLITPLCLSDSRYGRVPRIYIEATQDRALPLERQRAMCTCHPPIETRSLLSEHMVMVTAVDAVADMLVDIAVRYVGCS